MTLPSTTLSDEIQKRFPAESPVTVRSSWSGGTRTGVVKGWPSATSLAIEFRGPQGLSVETWSVLKVAR